MRMLILILVFMLLSASTYAYTYPKQFEKPWDHSPITYSLNRTFPPECDPTYEQDFFKGIIYWQNEGNGRLSFTPQFEETSGKADITIQWVRTVQNVSEEVGGITYISATSKKFVSARILLACGGIFQTRSGELYKEFSHREMQTTSMHELGHALGLDHTDDTYDIMTPKQIIQITPVGFETTSYNIDVNITPRRTLAGETIKFAGKTGPNLQLVFIEINQNRTVSFSKKELVTDSEGKFENSANFSATGRFLIEIYNPLSPNTYASSAIFIESGADVQVNSPVPTKIFVNGTAIGMAPLKLQNLRYGEHEILCRATDYNDYKTFVTVRQGSGDDMKAEPSRDAVLCAFDKPPEKLPERGFLDKLIEAIREFFRILLS